MKRFRKIVISIAVMSRLLFVLITLLVFFQQQPSPLSLPAAANALNLLVNETTAAALRAERHHDFHEYEILRDGCDWKYEGAPNKRSSCGLDYYTCEMKTTLPEGEGFYHIARYGPITTNGGLMGVLCNYQTYRPKKGTWLTRSFTAPMDPFTARVLGFPPYRIHHSSSVKFLAQQPPVPEQLLKQMPWLSSAERLTANMGIGTAAMDNQCLPEFGDRDCFLFQYVDGFGRKVYADDLHQVFSFHVQDVRLPDSPPITMFMESAQFYVSKQNPQRPKLKPAFELSLGVGRGGAPHTYTLQYNTPMYQFITYYFSMSVEILSTFFHSHSVIGDEGWLVRGTQSDLGIPTELQRPVDAEVKSGKHFDQFGPVHDAVPLEDSDTMSALKQRMEKNLNLVAAQYASAHRTNENTSEQRHRALRTAVAMPAKVGGNRKGGAHGHSSDSFSFIPYSEEEFKKRDSNVSFSISSPEILCKFHAINIELKLQDLELMRKEWYDAYNSLVDADADPILKKRAIIAPGNKKIDPLSRSIPLDDPVHHPHAVDNSHYSDREMSFDRPIKTAVSPEQQFENLFTGLQTGQYSRHFVKSTEIGGEEAQRYSQCDKFLVQAGEYITVVHFNEARQPPAKSDEYDHTQFTKDQHTFFNAQGHIRGYPYY